MFCPVCRDMTRDMYVSVGPEEVFKIHKFEKNNQFIYLDCSAKIKDKRYKTDYIINGVDNTFEVSIAEMEPEGGSVDKAQTPHFFFYIQSVCKQCLCTHAYGSDLELDLLNKKVTNIGVESETVILLTEPTKYHLSLNYSDNEMIISRCAEDEDGEVIDDDRQFHTALVDLDFSQPAKVVRKIKTIMVFS